MIFVVPKELKGKIKYIHNDVKVKEGIVLSGEEIKVFNDFRKSIKDGLKDIFE